MKTNEEKEKATMSKNPFCDLSIEEYKHLKQLLISEMLHRALSMKDDRVTNVRLTLVKSLRVMPEDIRNMRHVSTVVRTLEEEAHTWEGDGDYFDETMEMASTGGYYNNNSNTTTAAPQHVKNANDSSRYVGGTANIKNRVSSEQNPASITVKGIEAKQQKQSGTKENPNLGERDKSEIVPSGIKKEGSNVSSEKRVVRNKEDRSMASI